MFVPVLKTRAIWLDYRCKCCGEFHCVAACFILLQRAVNVTYSFECEGARHNHTVQYTFFPFLASVLQCVAVWCSVLQCVAVCCSVLQCVTVCCSVLQCVAVRCNAMCHCCRDFVITISRYMTLQQAATYCNTLQHTATHCSTLRHTVTHCTTLHRTAPYCNTLHHTATHCNTLQHTAPHCNTLHHTATHCTTYYHTPVTAARHVCKHSGGNSLQHIATHCNTMQNFAAHSCCCCKACLQTLWQ